LRSTQCWLSETAFSLYSLIPTIPASCLTYPQPEDESCSGDGVSLNTGSRSMQGAHLFFMLPVTRTGASKFRAVVVVRQLPMCEERQKLCIARPPYCNFTLCQKLP
jgi:hypothetical protein